MHKFNNIIRNTAACIFAALLSVSCLLDKDEPLVQMQSVMVEMNVSSAAMTKAEGTAAENAINTLRIYAFYGNKLAGSAYRNNVASGESFYMDLELPAEGKHNVDFYLIANEGEMLYESAAVQLSEKMTKAQLEAVKFTGLQTGSALPMYCKQQEEIDVEAVQGTENTQAGHNGHPILTRTLTFQLTRSMAKLSVYAARTDASAGNPVILGVTLLSQGTRMYNYLYPQTEEALESIASRPDDRSLLKETCEVKAAVEKGTAAADNPENYTEVVSGRYLAEVSEGFAFNDPSYNWLDFNGSDEELDRVAMLHVEYALGEGLERRNAYLYLPKVVRNHHIIFCILINADGQISLRYDVADWEWDEDRMQDFFFDYPTHSYVWHKIPEIEADLYVKPAEHAQMSEDQPFTGYFQMTYPSSDAWLPTLEGPNAPSCTVKVYDKNGTPVTEYPLPASEEWYKIEVKPKAGYLNAGDVVNLAITYTPSGLTESEYLLINGSHQDYFWPQSTDANYITITMVN